MMRRLVAVGLVSLAFAASAHGQQASPPRTAADSVFARARQLVATGNGAAGRILVDSMVTVTAPDTPEYAEALYWRATLAATSADAERDYRLIIVEYPLSPRAGEALFKLAQLESVRGDRLAAITHLERFLLENPRDAERNRAGFMLVRLEFEQNDTHRGCITLGRTLHEVPESNVELRNQLSYYSPRCAGVDTNRVAAALPDTTAKRDSTRRDSLSAAAKAKGRFTLQVAVAYTTRTEADRAAKRLKDRDVDARVVGAAKPYRVRIGRYETRAAATAAAKLLKARKIETIVTEVGSNDK